MADVTINAALATYNTEAGAWTQLVSVSDTVVYAFLIDASGKKVRYSKSTDAGATWGSLVSVLDTGESSNGYMTFAVWFDRWTPGDTGTLIHVIGHDWNNDEIQWRSLDTASDTLGTKRTVATGVSGTSSGANYTTVGYMSVTKAVGGNLYAFMHANGSDYFYRSTNAGTSWTSRTSPFEGDGDDQIQLVPGSDTDTNDIACVYLDDSADQVTFKLHDDSANTWGTETAIFSKAATEASDDQLYVTGVVRHSDGKLIVAGWNDVNNASADLVVYECTITAAGAAVSALTNIKTDRTGGAAVVGLMIDQNTDDIYAAYGYGTFSTAITWYWTVSTDGGTSWAAETAYSASTVSSRQICVNFSVASGDTGLFIPSWVNATDDLMVNAGNAVAIAAGPSFSIDHLLDEHSSAGFGTGAYTTAAFTPADNSLLIVHGALQTADAPGLASWTIDAVDGGGSSLGLTFTQRASTEPGSDGQPEAIWTAPITTGVSTRIKFDCGSKDVYIYFAQVENVVGHDATTPVGATGGAALAGDDGAQTLTLSAATQATSMVVGGRFLNAGSGQTNTATEGSGYTELADDAVTDTCSLQTQVRPPGSTSTDFDWVDVASGTGSAARGVAIEINLDGTGSSTTPKADDDTGAGTEGSPSIAATLSSSDTGSGAEGAFAIAATLSSSDTGSGAEGTPSISFSVTADTGSGAEGSPSIAATVSTSDTGSGTEGTPSIAATLSTSDTGSGTESWSIAVTISSSDTGSGADDEDVVDAGNTQIDGADTGSGTESWSIAVTLTQSDTGTGVETGLSVALSASDTGSGADSAVPVLRIAPASQETATGADSQSTTATLSASDTGTGVDDDNLFNGEAETKSSSDSFTTSERARVRRGRRNTWLSLKATINSQPILNRRADGTRGPLKDL